MVLFSLHPNRNDLIRRMRTRNSPHAYEWRQHRRRAFTDPDANRLSGEMSERAKLVKNVHLRSGGKWTGLLLLTYAIAACASLNPSRTSEFCPVASNLAAFEGREIRVEGEYLNAHPHGEALVTAECQIGITLVLTSSPLPEGRDELIRADVDAILLNDYQRRIFARFTGIVRRSNLGTYLDVRRVDRIRIVSHDNE